RFRDLDGTSLLELRSTGGQTLTPPSIHPSGEVLAWEAEGNPAIVEGSLLRTAVARTAAAAILSRHWPTAGTRHDAALALAGMLLSAGWAVDETVQFVAAVTIAAGDPEVDDRRRAVLDTAINQTNGAPITGVPTLARLLSRDLVARCVQWLGLAQYRGGT